MKLNQLVILPFIFSAAVWGGPIEDAYKMHNRIAGVPPSPAVLQNMAQLILDNNAEGAAQLAMENKNFINVTIKVWAKSFTNRDQTSRVPLNDMAATIMGAVRDNVPFNTVLYDDIIYVFEGPVIRMSGTNIAEEYNYAVNDNNYYEKAEDYRFTINGSSIDLSQKLIQGVQSEITEIPTEATSGILTTRAAGEAFYSAGTNRRVNRYTFMNFLCKDYEELHDISIPDFRVRRDVERDPGGVSLTYKNTCVGCHAGQDALAGAYAHYNFNPNSGLKLTYDPTMVTPKINNINSFSSGYFTTDDSWVNLWRFGKNEVLNWRGAPEGNGAKALNEMLTQSGAFSQCMAKHVFKIVCKHEPVSQDEINLVNTLAEDFESPNYEESKRYNMKRLFAKTSAGCLINEENL